MTRADGPLVSLVVRTHEGRRRLVEEALTSITDQHHRPIEVILVEDGSDECAALLESFTLDADIQVVHRRIPKAGRCVTGNVGLDLASGELLGFLDDDDRLEPDHLSVLVAALAQQPRCVAAYARALVVPTVIRSLEPLDYEEREAWVFRARSFSRWHLWNQNQFPIQACLFRRHLYEDRGGLDVSLALLEDWELWARYLSCGEPVAFVDRVTSMFRLPGDGGTLHGRERTLSRHISRAQLMIEGIEVTVSSGELRRAARTVMDDHYADSSWLTRAWAIVTRWRRAARFGFWVLGAGSRVASAVRGRVRQSSADLSSSSQQLVDAVLKGRDDVVVETTVGEAKVALSQVWRAHDLDRYLLLVARNRLGQTGVQTWAPVRMLRRLTRSAGGPPGSVGRARPGSGGPR